MIWNSYSQLEGKHAILSASDPSWLNYDADKTVAKWHSLKAAQHGSKMHDFAKMAIELGERLPENPPTTLSMYVNDAINFRMRPEQTLFATEWAFGTADAICFRNNILRIHDLKTGLNVAGFAQLEIYAAYFCMEYKENPFSLSDIELRIYQNDDVKIHHPDPDRIVHIREKALHDSRLFTELLKEEVA